MIRLGINIDHVATVRQARREVYPDPVQAAVLAELGGADNITAHLREDRRHIQDRDIFALKDQIKVPLNFEMGATDEMIAIALKVKPQAVTLVPEKREELTTEGGLDVARFSADLKPKIDRLTDAGIVVALFIEPDLKAIEISSALGAAAVEIHTGRFCKDIDSAGTTSARRDITSRLNKAAIHAHSAGLQVHFGHGLHYGNASWLQHISHAEEANIGHAVIGRAIFVGLKEAVSSMKSLLNDPSFKPFV